MDWPDAMQSCPQGQCALPGKAVHKAAQPNRTHFRNLQQKPVHQAHATHGG